MAEKVESDKEEENKPKLVRIEGDLYAGVMKEAKKMKATNSFIINYAIRDFLTKREYNFENLLELIENQPLLKLNKEIIQKAFKDAERLEPDTLKSLIEILKEGQLNFYLFKKENVEEYIKKINEERCKKVLVIIKINPTKKEEKDTTSFREFLNKFKELNCSSTKFNLLFAPDQPDELEFMTFILNKRDDKYDK